MRENKSIVPKIIFLLVILYLFLVSISLMGASFKLFGKDFAEMLFKTTMNPMIGLFIGILATSIMQSSSATTSVVVGLAAGGALPLGNAIPIVMGANIGTTVTNTIVSLAHITRKREFEGAFAAATVHDLFNILAVVVLLPIELKLHIIERSASVMASMFSNMGGFKFTSPLKLITSPVVNLLTENIGMPVILLVLSLFLLFFALTYLVKTMRLLVLEKIESFFDQYLFKTPINAFVLGLVITAVIQSSSVTTSLVVPLVGAGVLTVRKIFPYTLGSNVGTTITAILASLVTQNIIAITVAFAHLLFNVFGIVLFYPFRFIPITLAEKFSYIGTRSKPFVFIFISVVFFLLPLTLIMWVG